MIDPDLRQSLDGGVVLAVAPSPNAFANQTADAPYDGYVDYFGFDERGRWFFPDGKQWIEYKKLSEGDRARFLSATRSDLIMDRGTNQARMSIDQSKERKALLLFSCTNWYVITKDARGQLVQPPFNSANGSAGSEFGKWIDRANPAILALLEKEIRKANPWLLAEMSVEQIDKEIADLNELRRIAVEREENERNFSSK